MGDDGGGCSNCAAMAAQVAKLQAELAAARQEIQRLQERVQQLERVIRMARALCQGAKEEFGQVLSQRSGVKRGNWAYAKGGYTVACRILTALGG